MMELMAAGCPDTLLKKHDVLRVQPRFKGAISIRVNECGFCINNSIWKHVVFRTNILEGNCE